MTSGILLRNYSANALLEPTGHHRWGSWARGTAARRCSRAMTDLLQPLRASGCRNQLDAASNYENLHGQRALLAEILQVFHRDARTAHLQ